MSVSNQFTQKDIEMALKYRHLHALEKKYTMPAWAQTRLVVEADGSLDCRQLTMFERFFALFGWGCAAKGKKRLDEIKEKFSSTQPENFGESFTPNLDIAVMTAIFAGNSETFKAIYSNTLDSNGPNFFQDAVVSAIINGDHLAPLLIEECPPHFLAGTIYTKLNSTIRGIEDPNKKNLAIDRAIKQIDNISTSLLKLAKKLNPKYNEEADQEARTRLDSKFRRELNSLRPSNLTDNKDPV